MESDNYHLMTGKFYNLLHIALLQCMIMEFNIGILGYIRFARLVERHASVDN